MESSQLHVVKNRKSRAARVTHFVRRSSRALVSSWGAGVGVWDLEPGILDLFIVVVRGHEIVQLFAFQV